MNHIFKIGETLTNRYGDIILVVDNLPTTPDGHFRAIFIHHSYPDFIGREAHPMVGDLAWWKLNTQHQLVGLPKYQRGDLVEDRNEPWNRFMVIGAYLEGENTLFRCVDLATGEIYPYLPEDLTPTYNVLVGEQVT